MQNTIFIDTNVLIYLYDDRFPKKQLMARRLVKNNIENITISSQVVQEFCNVMLSGKVQVSMKQADLEEIVEDILIPMMQHVPSGEFYERTLRLHALGSISFYDALIVQAAIDTNCSVLYSEDLQDGRKYGSLTVVDPFKDL